MIAIPELDAVWLTKFGPILAESNGHLWFRFKNDAFLSCRLCGIVRRADDNNSPCKGRVHVGLRVSSSMPPDSHSGKLA